MYATPPKAQANTRIFKVWQLCPASLIFTFIGRGWGRQNIYHAKVKQSLTKQKKSFECGLKKLYFAFDAYLSI